MKYAVLLLSVAAALPSQHAELGQVQTVYLLPMSNGLDQYLANRLVNLGVFRVVADPKKAEAVFTDSLGAGFEARLDELFGEAEKPAEKKEPASEEAKPKEEKYTRLSTWGRGQGNVFIVGARDRSVLWSVHERAKDGSPEELDRTAERIARRIQRALKGK